jgi:hypothetical protein
MGHLTFVSAGNVPFEQHSCFAHHSSCFTQRFGSSESASISLLLSNAGSTLSVERRQQTLSSFAPKGKQQLSRFNGATVRREARVPTEVHH